jgi:antitoxin component YwqK of YwqJK toxin-antitoxin module
MKKLYYPNGKKQEESTFVDGVKDGIAKWYDQDENIIAEYNYSKGELNGEQKTFYTSGTVRTQDTYNNGKQTGEHLEYFENGTIKQKGNFDKDEKKDGEWIEFDQTGKKIKTVKYKAGTLQ